MSFFGFTERNHKKQVYSKDEVDNLLPDMTDYYNKEETDSAIENAVEDVTSGFVSETELNAKVTFLFYLKSGINVSLTPGTHMITYIGTEQTISAGSTLELFYPIPEGYRDGDDCLFFPCMFDPEDGDGEVTKVCIMDTIPTADNYLQITVYNPSSASVKLDPKNTSVRIVAVKDPNMVIVDLES